jgi:hypothetical protein
MGGHDHVGRPIRQRIVDDAGVDFLQAVRVVAALAGLLQLFLRAEIGPDRIVELKITTAGVVKRLDGLAVGLAEILEEYVEIDRPPSRSLRPPRKCGGGRRIVIFAIQRRIVFFRNDRPACFWGATRWAPRRGLGANELRSRSGW